MQSVMVSPHKAISAAVTTKELLEDFDRALASPNEIFGYGRYGDGRRWANLDKLTGGLQERTLGVLAARPKVGKSMLATDVVPFIAEQALLDEKVVRIISLEMSRKAYQRRMAAIMAGVNPKNIRTGFADRYEQKRYRTALATLAALPIEYLAVEKDLEEDEAMVEGNSPITIADVIAFVRNKPKGDTYWWLLDHIGLLNDLSAYKDVTTNTYALANKLMSLAHRTAAGLVITHLNRASIGRRPSIESIANSDQVGKCADVLFFLKRPFYEEDISEEDRALVEADRAEPAFLEFQSRDEGGGVVYLLWDMDKAAFDEMQLAPGVRPRMPVTRRGQRR